MFRLVWSQVRRRGGRTVALGLAVLVAASAFTVLTASARASRLQTVGQVQAHARTLYDILVRPKDARSELERRRGLVQPGFLSGIYGGITLAQWREIKGVPGIDVAAPVAMVGYVDPQVPLVADTTAAMSRTGPSVARVDVTWSMDNGLTHEKQQPQFVFSAPRALRPGAPASRLRCGSSTNPFGPAAPGTTVRTLPSRLQCFLKATTADGRAFGDPAPGHVGTEVDFPFPFLVAAVDPAQEAELDGLDQARVSGKSLTARAAKASPRTVPVVVANSAPVQTSLTVRVSRLSAAGAAAAQANKPIADLARILPTPRFQRRVTSEDAYRQLLKQLSSDRTDVGYLGNVWQYWSVSGPHYVDNGGTFTPSKVNNKLDQLWVDPSVGQQVPAGTDGTGFRSITAHRQNANTPLEGRPPPPALSVRGTFDPAKLKGLSDVTAQILGGYATAPTLGADARSTKLLGGKALAASSNIAGLVQPPPLMLTSLDSLPALTQGGWQPNTSAAPISAIRVRVAGVTGVDALSRERVRLAADRIRRTTGLAVDVTVGSSAATETIALPAGQLGRPALSLSQYWVKKGVATTIIDAVDKKSLVIFALVLLVCALSVANSAVASVRTRRTELGVLAALGWGRRQLFTVVLGELTVIAVVAGVLAAAVALGLGAAFGTTVSLSRAALAVPAALVVALVAGFVPAWLAARADPMEAIRPVVHQLKSGRQPRTVSGLGVVNLLRSRARALIAASGLTVAVAAFTLLLAITLAFQGAVVGSILGDAVAVQVRGADYTATIATLVLAGLGVANVLYLNIRDRGPEIATLQALGWRARDLSRLVIVEALGIGLAGAITGAILGLLAAAVLAGGLTAPVIGAAALAAIAGIALAALASVVPVRMLRRLPTAILLTEELPTPWPRLGPRRHPKTPMTPHASSFAA